MKPFHGCLLGLAVVFTVVGVYFYARNDDLTELAYAKTLQMLRREVASKPPAGYTRHRVEFLFDRVIKKLQTGTLNRNEARELNTRLSRMLVDSKVDSLEISALLTNLERLTMRN